MKNNIFLTILSFSFLFSVQSILAQENSAKSFTSAIENAHNKNAFLSKKAVEYNLKLTFGGKSRIDAKITQSTDGSKIRIDYAEGKTVVFDGKEVFGFPTKASYKGARFDIFTWSYFFALPYKLNDDGTNWETSKPNKWGGEDVLSNKLTFNDGVGDTPKDWYVVYANPETNYLEGTAYIVSFGKKLEKAEADPHAIKYAEFEAVDGIPFATKWTFHNWNKEEGYTDVIGEGTISDIKFIDKEASFFEKENKDIKPIEMKPTH